jgi:hypothetical protein
MFVYSVGREALMMSTLCIRLAHRGLLSHGDGDLKPRKKSPQATPIGTSLHDLASFFSSSLIRRLSLWMAAPHVGNVDFHRVNVLEL